MDVASIKSHLNDISKDYGLSILYSGAPSFAINAVLISTTAGIAYGCVAALAAAINGLVNPALKNCYQSSKLNFWHDLGYKTAILFTAKMLVNLALGTAFGSALIVGTIGLFVLRGYYNNFMPVDLTKNSLWGLTV